MFKIIYLYLKVLKISDLNKLLLKSFTLLIVCRYNMHVDIIIPYLSVNNHVIGSLEV